MINRATYAAIVGACSAFANSAKDLILDSFRDEGIPPPVARGKRGFILVLRVGIVCFFDNSDII